MASPILAQELAARLRRDLRLADIDLEAFTTPLAICDLASCRATCCHDGVVLDPEEVRLLEPLLQQHAKHFERYGISTSKTPFTTSTSQPPRTTTRPALPEELPLAFPSHFSRTRCLFLDTEHRCAWQRLAHDLDQPPWTFKPVSCWMHPISLTSRPGRTPLLTLAGDAEAPQDFARNTPCGRPCDSGPPASETLSGELQLLGEIAGRDFLREIQQANDQRAK